MWQPAAVEPVDVVLRATGFLRSALPAGVYVGDVRPTEATVPYPAHIVTLRRDGGPTGVLDRQAVITGYLLKFTHEVAVSRLWRVEVRGDMCRIEGRPAVWHAPKSDLTDTLIKAEIIHG